MNLADQLKGKYQGVLASSKTKKLEDLKVEAADLNDSLVKITFTYQGVMVSFRALLNENTDGVLMIVKEHTTKEYILSGMDGFIYKRNNVHGGLLYNLDSFYFHIRLNTFEGKEHELYFLGKSQTETIGKETDSRLVMQA